MRRIIIITCLVLSGLIILDSMNAGHAFMMFLLAGVIPGTSTALSAEVMMEGFALLIGFVMARVSARFILQLSERFSLRIRSRA